MATTTARNQQDVDKMATKDRVWDSLNYSYGKKREESDRAYEKAISSQEDPAGCTVMKDETARVSS